MTLYRDVEAVCVEQAGELYPDAAQACLSDDRRRQHPADDFTLHSGDPIRISIDGIGASKLCRSAQQRAELLHENLS